MKRISLSMFFILSATIAVQILILSWAQSYYQYILKAFTHHNLDNTLVITGVPNKKISPSNFVIESSMPLIDRSSISSLTELPFIETIISTGQRSYDVSVNGNKYTNVWLRTVPREFFKAFNITYPGDAGLSVSPKIAKIWGINQIDNNVLLNIPESVTEQLDGVVKEAILKQFQSQEIKVSTVLDIKDTGISFLDDLIVVDKEYSARNLSNLFIEPTIMFVKLNNSISLGKAKKILTNLLSSSIETVIPGMELNITSALDYLEPVISKKDLGTLLFWLNIIIISAIFLIVMFVELGRFGQIRQEIALRRVFGADMTSAIYYSIKNRMLTNFWALIFSVAFCYVSLFIISQYLPYKVTIQNKVLIFSFLIYFVSLLVPFLLMLNASRTDPKLILSRVY